jgi:hypothetical protein
MDIVMHKSPKILRQNSEKPLKTFWSSSDSVLIQKTIQSNTSSLPKISKFLNKSLSPSQSFFKLKDQTISKPNFKPVAAKAGFNSSLKANTFSYSLPFVKNSKIYTTSKVDLFSIDLAGKGEGFAIHNYFPPKAGNMNKQKAKKKRCTKFL